MEHQNIRLRLRNGDNENSAEIEDYEQNKYNRNSNNISLPIYAPVIVLIVGFLLFGLAYVLHYRLPTPLTLKDIETHPDKFIAERALNHLRQLTGFGSKPVGSYENEVLTVEFLTREISFIMQQANPMQKISFDIQKCTGSYALSFKPHGFINYYSQVQNIVVKLSSNTNSSSSLMINCHFDSVPTSPGGSDDGLNCAVMLEVLEILARSKTPLKHNVIFLFNGAEESPLQASHGFITQHRWAHEVKAFINLEACGAGGREVLFQAGPNHPWLIEMYADSVPHPHAQVLAEDIFQSGLVPSDTDFRIFRDFGHVPGLDFAHAMNGYVYHTSYDNLHAIPIGTLQHTGDNLLSLIRQIASSDILSNPEKHAAGRAVYYDVMGLYIIRYSETVGIVLNMITAALSTCTVLMNIFTIRAGLTRAKAWKLLLLGCGVPAGGWVLAFLTVLFIAMIVDTVNATMSWFTRPSLIFTLYYCPVLACCMGIPVLFHKYLAKQPVLSPIIQGRLYLNGVQLLWTILLLGGTVLGVRSTFMFMLVVWSPTLTSLMLSLTRWKQNTQVWVVVYLASTLPAVLFIFYHTVMAFGLFIPITGRIGSVTNPDFIIGTFATLLCILSSSYVTPLIVLVRSPWKVLATAAGVLVLTLLAVIITPLGFPFSANPSAPSPQRIHVYHTERTFHEVSGHVRYQDSGYWLVDLDHNSPGSVQSLIPEVAEAESVCPMCDQELVCGLPLFSPRVLQICKYTHWIPASPPVLHLPTNLELTSEKNISDTVRRLSFSVKGPDHMAVVLGPTVKLIGWSFAKEVYETGYEWQNKPTYYINYAQGLTGTPFEFWIDLEITEEPPGFIIEIGVIGHYINNHGEISEEFRKFLRKYPDWAHVTAWAATYKAWRF